MKKSYVKPVINASMEGTLEGVYAYGNVMALCPTNGQPNDKKSKNPGGCVPATQLQPACFNLEWLWRLFNGGCGNGGHDQHHGGGRSWWEFFEDWG